MANTGQAGKEIFLHVTPRRRMPHRNIKTEASLKVAPPCPLLS